MFFVYIVQNALTGRYYIGHTSNIEARLKQHNLGRTKSLRHRGPFQLVYKEEYPDKQSAYRREQQMKRYKGGNALRNLLQKAMV